MSLLKVHNLKLFDQKNNELVKGIHFSIQSGQWFAVIGESGSGKSLSAFSLTGIVPNGIEVKADSILFNQIELTTLESNKMRTLRGKEIAYVFQDYQTSFTPYKRLGQQMDETLSAHFNDSKQQRKTKIVSALNSVGLEAKLYDRYPFQLSGGQLQRTALVLAMMMKPKLLIADEPTTALDAVSAQTVLELIAKHKEETGCAVLFISHDLRTVRRYADKIAIMRKGQIIEQGSKATILANPQQDYTRNLLASIPPLHNPPSRLPIFCDKNESCNI